MIWRSKVSNMGLDQRLKEEKYMNFENHHRANTSLQFFHSSQSVFILLNKIRNLSNKNLLNFNHEKTQAGTKSLKYFDCVLRYLILGSEK